MRTTGYMSLRFSRANFGRACEKAYNAHVLLDKENLGTRREQRHALESVHLCWCALLVTTSRRMHQAHTADGLLVVLKGLVERLCNSSVGDV